MDRVTVFCFFASYAVALGLELWHLRRPRPVFRLLALGFGVAGLLAQTLYLYFHLPPLQGPFGWLLVLGWVLAVFYLCGSVHHGGRQAWGIFVLPLLLGLLAAGTFGAPAPDASAPWSVESPWGPIHVVLLMLATVGLCVGSLASLMYLVQAHRLRTKAPPGRGLRLLSLERLEAMNRRALLLAFPLLTAGMLAGGIMLLGGSERVTWFDPRVVSTGVLWLVFALLLYLRFGLHLRGRQTAVLTLAAFLLLLGTVFLSHSLPAMGPQP